MPGVIAVVHYQFPEDIRVHGSRLISLAKENSRTVVSNSLDIRTVRFVPCVKIITNENSESLNMVPLIASREDKGCLQQENGE